MSYENQKMHSFTTINSMCQHIPLVALSTHIKSDKHLLPTGTKATDANSVSYRIPCIIYSSIYVTRHDMQLGKQKKSVSTILLYLNSFFNQICRVIARKARRSDHALQKIREHSYHNKIYRHLPKTLKVELFGSINNPKRCIY